MRGSGSGRWLRAVALVALLSAATLGSLASGGRTLLATPAGAAPVAPALNPVQQQAEQIVQGFFAAYDRKDVSAVLDLLASPVKWADCDYAHHRSVLLEFKAAIRRWLTARFRENDRYEFVGTLVPGTGTGFPLQVGGSPIRRSTSLDPLIARGLVPSPELGFKIVVDDSGHISAAVLGDNRECLAGTTPVGAKLKKERALAQAFLSAYNRHDLAGVVALFEQNDPNSFYEDCDPTQGTSVVLTSRVAIGAWLHNRFAAGDSVLQPRTLLRSWLSQPKNDPRTTVIRGNRSTAPGSAVQPLLLAIVPNTAANRIHSLQWWCPSATS